MYVTEGQLAYEWEHLLKKIKYRDSVFYNIIKNEAPIPHPIFSVINGEIEKWEKV